MAVPLNAQVRSLVICVIGVCILVLLFYAHVLLLSLFLLSVTSLTNENFIDTDDSFIKNLLMALELSELYHDLTYKMVLWVNDLLLTALVNMYSMNYQIGSAWILFAKVSEQDLGFVGFHRYKLD
ncbi:hypothetical protein RND71_009785 [Anisodus tanguticus]|uniref:Uncharacterized protein n=1 Tax=Anisodus tanguticus TaxID=243964 RepID=A0AAE1SIF2_9SOLA|nr:hypothetical protein RND71_009785 [Anisodus tanguticus]